MLTRETLVKQINDRFAVLQHSIKNGNRIGMYDSDVAAEDFVKDLLNLIFGWRLVNLNSLRKNQVGVDLGDKGSKIAVQVTSENSREKLQETLDHFESHRLYKTYDRLCFFILVDKKKYKPFKPNRHFSFDASKDVFDFNELLTHIKSAELEKLEKLDQFLSDQIDLGKRHKQSRSKNRATARRTSTLFSTIKKPKTTERGQSLSSRSSRIRKLARELGLRSKELGEALARIANLFDKIRQADIPKSMRLLRIIVERTKSDHVPRKDILHAARLDWGEFVRELHILEYHGLIRDEFEEDCIYLNDRRAWDDLKGICSTTNTDITVIANLSSGGFSGNIRLGANLLPGGNRHGRHVHCNRLCRIRPTLSDFLG